MKTKTFIAASVLALAFLPSCSNFGPSDTYKEGDIGETMEVKTGKITSLKEVLINPQDRDYGTYLGAAGGALGGSTLGGGTGNTLFTLGGLAAGALTGNQLDKAVNQQKGYQIEVKVDGEKTILAVRQAKDSNMPLWVGQQVKVYKGYKASRVEPY